MQKRWGLVINQERCIGCEACTVACKYKIENSPTAGHWIRVETVGGGQKDTPAGKYPDLRMDFLPRLCMHCDHPPCLEACPTSAFRKREDGLVVLDSEKCNGCQECVGACPYEAIFYSSNKGLVEKCSFCDHRIDQDLEHLEKPERETNHGRKKDKENIYADIRKGLQQHTTAEFIELCLAQNLSVAPVNSTRDVAQLDFVNKHMLQTKLPSGKHLALFPPPVDTKFLSDHGNLLKCAPRLGEHNEAIFREAGFSNEEIRGLKNDRVI